ASALASRPAAHGQLHSGRSGLVRLSVPVGAPVQTPAGPASAAQVGATGGQVPDLAGLGARAAIGPPVGADRGPDSVADIDVQDRLLEGEGPRPARSRSSTTRPAACS